MDRALPLPKRVGLVLKQRREALKISQEQLAERVGRMDRIRCSSIERGEINVTIKTLERLCEALNVPMSQVFKDAGN